MVLVGDLGFSTLWIATSITLFIVVGAYAGIFFAPAVRRQLAAATGDAPAAEYTAAARRTTLTGTITMVLVGAIVFMMVMKPT
jgi:hypothetical protein